MSGGACVHCGPICQFVRLTEVAVLYVYTNKLRELAY